MEYVRLGSSGLKVSRICLGMMSYGDPSWREWMLDEDGAEPIVRRGVELGVTFFDTADVYSMGVSEQITGRLLRKLFARREDYVLATKVCLPTGDGPNDRGLSRKHIFSSIGDSLRRLGTDYVDLYQIHRWDNDTPIDETMEALNDLVRTGKVRYIGASSMYAWQFATAQHAAELRGWAKFSSMQNHYNLMYREEEREMIPFCRHTGVGIIPWSPLARGWLAGNRGSDRRAATTRAGSDAIARELYDASDLSVVDAANKAAAERGVPTAQVALAWLLSRPGVTSPIIGATKVEHLDDAVAALDLSLSDREISALETPYRPHAVRGHG
jgi:aryl-alcohol dehydrogenase-like predicted oxidoreductase